MRVPGGWLVGFGLWVVGMGVDEGSHCPLMDSRNPTQSLPCACHSHRFRARLASSPMAFQRLAADRGKYWFGIVLLLAWLQKMARDKNKIW